MVPSPRAVSCRLLFLLASAVVLAGGARAQITGAPLVSQSLPAITLKAGSAPATLDLRDYFTIFGVTGQIVQFDTTSGKFNTELFASDAPVNVANFLGYVNGGSYTNSIIHRSVLNFIIQGGGYLANASLSSISKPTTAKLEYKRPNLRGTLAMARTSDPNSASSEWFVNLIDNTTTLGPGGSSPEGYTVFARVIGTGMTVADAIGALPIYRGFSSPFGELPVRNFSTGVPGLANIVVVNSVTVVPVAPASAGARAVLGFVRTIADATIADTAISGSTLTIAAKRGGSTTVTVRATDSNGNFVESTLALTATADPAPVITAQPDSVTVAVGGRATFTAAATGSPAPSYQWLKDGVEILGATSSTFTIASVQATDAGSYALRAGNNGGDVTTSPATLTVTGAGTGGNAKLSNLSVRTTMADGQTLIVGFNVNGGAKDVLVRAAGPVLATFGVTSAMADPKMALFRSSDGAKVAENDNWPAVLAPAFEAVGAFPFPNQSNDAAFKQTLNGGYSVQVTGTGPGTVLVEGYDAGTGRAVRLINLSARNRVGTGENILIVGFFVAGTGTQRLLIRAVGPKLVDFGVPDVLLDPKVELYNSSDGVKIADNDNWDASLAATFRSVGAFDLTPGSKDAAIVVTVPAGASYSLQIKGADGGTGEALAEVYELP